jgi:hypothetical protein
VKTAFRLFILSLIAIAVFIVTDTPGFGIHNGRAIGEAFGASLGLFVVGMAIAGIVAIFDRKSDAPFVLGTVALVAVAALSWYGTHYLEQPPAFTAEEISKIKTAAKELGAFAESLPDCSKGFPTGARKEIWDTYIRYCEPGVIVPKGR